MSESKALAAARAEAIRLLRDEEDWVVLATPRLSLYRMGLTELAAVDLVVDRLLAGFPLSEVQLGDPPGSGGIGYALTNADGKGLYIKFKIEDDRVKFLSFKPSDHLRPG